MDDLKMINTLFAPGKSSTERASDAKRIYKDYAAQDEPGVLGSGVLPGVIAGAPVGGLGYLSGKALGLKGKGAALLGAGAGLLSGGAVGKIHYDTSKEQHSNAKVMQHADLADMARRIDTLDRTNDMKTDKDADEWISNFNHFMYGGTSTTPKGVSAVSQNKIQNNPLPTKTASSLDPNSFNTSVATLAGAMGALDNYREAKNKERDELHKSQIEQLKGRMASEGGGRVLDKARLIKMEVEEKTRGVRRKYPKATSIISGLANATVGYGLASASGIGAKSRDAGAPYRNISEYKLASAPIEDLYKEACIHYVSTGGNCTTDDMYDVLLYLDSEKVANVSGFNQIPKSMSTYPDSSTTTTGSTSGGKDGGGSLWSKVKPYAPTLGLLAGGALAHRIGSKMWKGFRGDMDKIRHITSSRYGVSSEDAIKHWHGLGDDARVAIREMSKEVDHGDLYNMGSKEIANVINKHRPKTASIDFASMDPASLDVLEAMRPEAGQFAGLGVGGALGALGANAMGVPGWLGAGVGMVAGAPVGEFIARSTMDPEKQLALMQLEDQVNKVAEDRSFLDQYGAPIALGASALAAGLGGYALYQNRKLLSSAGGDVVEQAMKNNPATKSTVAVPDAKDIKDAVNAVESSNAAKHVGSTADELVDALNNLK